MKRWKTPKYLKICLDTASHKLYYVNYEMRPAQPL